MKRKSIKTALKFSSVLFTGALVASVTFINGCSKKSDAAHNPVAEATMKQVCTAVPLVQREPITSVVTVANIRKTKDGSATRVMFIQNAQIFTVSDEAAIEMLKKALADNTAVKITFDPWQGIVTQVSVAAAADQQYFRTKAVESEVGTVLRLNEATNADIDRAAEMGILNLTTDTLTNVIPDFTTAQQMFDYIAHQCCQLPGPYTLDHCITFQYCQDGCYARAHKMCMIINSKYHYGTKKIFSFANSGSDELCVQAQKWGGCCINWWYHVAPLVTIKTPTGPKAYVFDPAMFDQPVLLSVWLHAQENPACAFGGDVPHVSMINIKPTSAYAPASGSGLTFSPDPTYYDTNNTLVDYRYLISCP